MKITVNFQNNLNKTQKLDYAGNQFGIPEFFIVAFPSSVTTKYQYQNIISWIQFQFPSVNIFLWKELHIQYCD